jgi:DNA-binding MarR family transcriptional regulator
VSDVRETVVEQLEQLQTLMHRMAFHGYLGDGRAARNPYRGQGRVLAALKEMPEISQKELTERLGMSKQSLAELLGKLEKNGLIAREPSQSDRRSVTVRLLEKGARAAENLRESSMDGLRIFDGLEREELAQFSDYLSRIIQRCAETFAGDSSEERSRHMQSFLSHNDFSFRQADPEHSYTGGHRGYQYGKGPGGGDREEK